MAFWGDNDADRAFVIINFVAVFIGCASSVLCLLLIYRMKVFTGHIQLLILLSVYQFVYDFFCIQNNLDVDYDQKTFAIFGHLVSGTTSSIISNWIAFSAFYIVAYHRVFDILKNYYMIHGVSLLIGLFCGILYYVSVVPEHAKNDALTDIAVIYVYNNVRMASIAVNFFFAFVIVVKIYAISSKGTQISDQELAIRTLARRMILYPITQAIGRVGYAWYEYGYGSGAYVVVDGTDATEYACIIFLSVITPSVSVGYLIIFLVMQPKAYDHFKALIFCQPLSVTEELQDNSLFRLEDIQAVSQKNSVVSMLSCAGSELRRTADGRVEDSGIELFNSEFRMTNVSAILRESVISNTGSTYSDTVGSVRNGSSLSNKYSLRGEEELSDIIARGSLTLKYTPRDPATTAKHNSWKGTNPQDRMRTTTGNTVGDDGEEHPHAGEKNDVVTIENALHQQHHRKDVP
jgi:hypothetical protein